MADVLIRGLPPEAVAILRSRAEADGKSLNAALKEIVIAAAAQPQADADWDRIRAFRLSGRGRWKGPSILEMLREDRDRR